MPWSTARLKADERLLSLLGAAVGHRLFLLQKRPANVFAKTGENELRGPGHKTGQFGFLRREYRGRSLLCGVQRCSALRWVEGEGPSAGQG